MKHSGRCRTLSTFIMTKYSQRYKDTSMHWMKTKLQHLIIVIVLGSSVGALITKDY